MEVALIFGGRSLERDISVITAMQTLKNAPKNIRLIPVFMYDGDFYIDNLDRLDKFVDFNISDHKKAVLIKGAFYSFARKGLKREFKPSAALVCCHGGEGENGVLQAILEYNGIPYTCPGVTASAIGMDKAVSKQVFEALRMNVLPYETVYASELSVDPNAVLSRLEVMIGYPMIVKPATQGSSIGINVANDPDELKFALEVAAEYGEKALAERKLENFTEVNCAAFRDGDRIVVSETERPVSSHDFLTFDDKYISGGKGAAERRIPADIGALEPIVKANTERLYKALDLNGVVRMDYLTDGKKLYINEINTVPGSLAYYLFTPMGISFGQLISSLVQNAALSQKSERKTYRADVLSALKNGAKTQK